MRCQRGGETRYNLLISCVVARRTRPSNLARILSSDRRHRAERIRFGDGFRKFRSAARDCVAVGLRLFRGVFRVLSVEDRPRALLADGIVLRANLCGTNFK